MESYDEPVSRVQHAANVDLIVMLVVFRNDPYGRLVDCPFSNTWRRASMCITILFAKLGAFQELVAEAAEFAFVYYGTVSLEFVNHTQTSMGYSE